jgi:hypothetical protein
MTATTIAIAKINIRMIFRIKAANAKKTTNNLNINSKG